MGGKCFLPTEPSQRPYNLLFKIHISCGWWWHEPLISALGRQEQADLYEMEASLVYKVSSRIARDPKGKKLLSKSKAELAVAFVRKIIT